MVKLYLKDKKYPRSTIFTERSKHERSKELKYYEDENDEFNHIIKEFKLQRPGQEFDSEALERLELETIIRCCLNWTQISRYYKMSIPFMTKFKHYINWPILTQYQRLSEEKLILFKKEIPTTLMLQYQVLSEDFILNNLNDKILDFNNYINNIAKYQILPLKLYDHKKLNQSIVTKYQPIDNILENLKTGSHPILETDVIIERFLTKEQIMFFWPSLDEFQRIILCKRSKIDISLLFHFDMSFELDTLLKYQKYNEEELERIISHYDNVDFDVIYKYQSYSKSFETKYKYKFPTVSKKEVLNFCLFQGTRNWLGSLGLMTNQLLKKNTGPHNSLSITRNLPEKSI